MNSAAERDALFARICDGVASADDVAQLQRLIREDPASLDAWIHYSALHADLAAGSSWPVGADTAEGLGDNAVGEGDASLARPHARLPWIPQMAAGLALGLFAAATLVWAYVTPLMPKVITVLEEDFENPRLPLASRSVLDAGMWRGDAAEVVASENGIMPSHGSRMLRFLRSDYAGAPKPAGGHIATVYRLIDLRPYRKQIAAGNSVVEVSARFNAAAFPDRESYGCAISLYALDVDSLPDRAGRLGTLLSNEALAMARSSQILLDRAPATWQRVTTELRVPRDAEFLAVRLHISQTSEPVGATVFTGSYVDDVHVSLTERPPVP